MTIPSQKHLFDIPPGVSYLNNAYMSPLMHSVTAAMHSGIASKAQPWTISPEDFFTYAEEARGLAGRIFGGPADNIAIVPSVSYGLQIAANALPIKAGQNIIVLGDQFPSNIYPWQQKAAQCGAVLNILPVPIDEDWTGAVLSAIDENTAIAAVPQTHWASGATLDLFRVRQALDTVGAALVLDLTQSLGAQVFDAGTVRPDFAVAATYKWLMGPYSMGFLYVDPKWHTAPPLEHNWINRKGSEDFTRLTEYQDAFAVGARRFDMGEKSNASQLAGASAALAQILDWGVGNIADTLAMKTGAIAKQLAPLGFAAPLTRAPHYLGLQRVGGVPGGLSSALAARQIYVSVRGPALRVTPHLYCDDNDIDRLVEGVRALVV